MSKGFSDNKLAPPAPPAAQPSSNTTCVLGPTLHFKGELYGEEDLDFQGQLEGSIEHTRSLSIGKDGGVTGNIRAKFVCCRWEPTSLNSLPLFQAKPNGGNCWLRSTATRTRGCCFMLGGFRLKKTCRC